MHSSVLTTARTLNPDNLFSLRDCNNFKKRTFAPCTCKQMRNSMYNLKKRETHVSFCEKKTKKQQKKAQKSKMMTLFLMYLQWEVLYFCICWLIHGATEGCLPVNKSGALPSYVCAAIPFSLYPQRKLFSGSSCLRG